MTLAWMICIALVNLEKYRQNIGIKLSTAKKPQNLIVKLKQSHIHEFQNAFFYLLLIVS